MSKMKSDTPARLLRPSNRRANIAAFEDCLNRIKSEKIKTALDIRYGLGGWAKSLRKRFPKCLVYGIEGDQATAEAAWQEEGVELVFNLFPLGVSPSWPKKFDLLLADFNNSTALKLEPLKEAIEIAAPRFLIFTDVACSKLHLNYESYGLKNPSLAEYYEKMTVEGFRRLDWSQKQAHASTSVWIRE